MAATRIVLVDDDDGIAALLAASFEDDERFELVGRARNGQEGVELTHRLRPDAVLMDLHMPVLGGVAATRALIARMPEACIIAFTSSNDRQEHQAVLNAGAAAVLQKPFDPERFLDAVAAHARGCARSATAA
jgi:DNA-binding NarL/FixJ family response regulator